MPDGDGSIFAGIEDVRSWWSTWLAQLILGNWKGIRQRISRYGHPYGYPYETLAARMRIMECYAQGILAFEGIHTDYRFKEDKVVIYAKALQLYDQDRRSNDKPIGSILNNMLATTRAKIKEDSMVFDLLNGALVFMFGPDGENIFPEVNPQASRLEKTKVRVLDNLISILHEHFSAYSEKFPRHVKEFIRVKQHSAEASKKTSDLRLGYVSIKALLFRDFITKCQAVDQKIEAPIEGAAPDLHTYKKQSPQRFSPV
jgi:hypothetical protein